MMTESENSAQTNLNVQLAIITTEIEEALAALSRHFAHNAKQLREELEYLQKLHGKATSSPNTAANHLKAMMDYCGKKQADTTYALNQTYNWPALIAQNSQTKSNKEQVIKNLNANITAIKTAIAYAITSYEKLQKSTTNTNVTQPADTPTVTTETRGTGKLSVKSVRSTVTPTHRLSTKTGFTAAAQRLFNKKTGNADEDDKKTPLLHSQFGD